MIPTFPPGNAERELGSSRRVEMKQNHEAKNAELELGDPRPEARNATRN